MPLIRANFGLSGCEKNTLAGVCPYFVILWTFFKISIKYNDTDNSLEGRNNVEYDDIDSDSFSNDDFSDIESD